MSREEEAEREIGTTHVHSRVKTFLVLFFLISAIAVPLWQSTQGFGVRWTGIDADSAGRDFFGLFTAASHSLKLACQEVENSLEENSFLTKTLLPALQTPAYRHLGLGNEKVYAASGGWLYYRPDVDYILEGSGTASRRIGKASDAILRFGADLKARGIRLIVLPVPVKPVVETEPLGGAKAPRSLHSAVYAGFLENLRANGVEVFDSTELLCRLRESSGRPQFLKTDSHWTPEAMDAVAEELARFLGINSHEGSRLKQREPTSVKNTGDLANMLKLKPEAAAALSEHAEIRSVVLADGTPWRTDPQSDVLLLGDSFTNIYSTADLGWGEGAGFAERLSLHLGRPVDRLAVNAGGALTVRQSLARSPERLDGKGTVVYQFAVRELTSGDWRPVSIPAKASEARANPAVASIRGPRVLKGTVKAVSALPPPGSVPYKDAVISLQLVDIEGQPESEALIFLLGMEKNIPTDAALIREGDKISVGAVPWESVEDKYGSITRIELEGQAAELETIYWAQEEVARIGEK